MSDDNPPNPYASEYRRSLLSMLSVMLREEDRPDVDMDEAAAIAWFRPILWSALKTQSYTSQAIDLEVMGEADAWVAVLQAFHALLFNGRDPAVELGPTFVLGKESAFWVQSYADAELVRKAREVKQQEQTHE
jgi:hypothetical protein